MYWGHLIIHYRAIRKANVTIPSSSGGGLETDWQFRPDRQAYHTRYAWEPVRRAYSRPWYISCNCSAIPPLFAKSWLKIHSLYFQSSIIDLQRGFDRTLRTPPPTRLKSVHFVLFSVPLENSLVSSWRILSSVHEKFGVWIKLPKLIIRVDPNRY